MDKMTNNKNDALEALGAIYVILSDPEKVYYTIEIIDDLIKTIRAALTSAEPQWRDINSAPKDGSSFIGFNPTLGVRRDVQWSFKRNDFDLNGCSSLDRNWTHWMPQTELPQPPKEGIK